MRRFEYNDLKSRRTAYYQVFETKLPMIESGWLALKNNEPWLASFDFRAIDLMLGNIDMLITVYLKFEQAFDVWKIGKSKDERKSMKKKISDVFDYSSYHDKLVSFFTNQANGFDIHTCYYCESAYINLYPYQGSKRNHFDLDHILDKGTCPLLGLSMLNFVPSCQCCNEKIKRQKIFGYDKPQQKLTRKEFLAARFHIKKLMPTSTLFDFDAWVKMEVVMKQLPHGKGFMKYKDAYSMSFKTKDSDYDDYIDKLHLRERYDYHKSEALRILDLRERYTGSTIRKISTLLGLTESHVKEDIFAVGFNQNEHRCFEKLHRDILK